MRILHLSKFYPPDTFGGIESVCRDTCEILDSSHFDITVLAFTKNTHSYFEELNHVKIFRFRIIKIFSFFKIS